MVGIDDSSLQVDSQHVTVVFVRVL